MAPGAPTTVDRPTVVRVAAEVADRDGWRNLTLSQVAREVDRHVTSLYAHIDGLDRLRREVALLAFDELADRTGRAAMGRTRDNALRAIASVYADYARAHPGRTEALLTTPVGEDPDLVARALRLAEPIRATLRSYGLEDGQVVAAHRVFSATVLGLVRGDADADGLRHAVDLFVVGLTSGRWPEG